MTLSTGSVARQGRGAPCGRTSARFFWRQWARRLGLGTCGAFRTSASSTAAGRSSSRTSFPCSCLGSLSWCSSWGSGSSDRRASSTQCTRSTLRLRGSRGRQCSTRFSLASSTAWSWPGLSSTCCTRFPSPGQRPSRRRATPRIRWSRREGSGGYRRRPRCTRTRATSRRDRRRCAIYG